MNLISLLSLFCYKYASEYYSDMIIESTHACIEFSCIHGLTLVGKYLNFIGNVRRSFVGTNQGSSYSSKQFCTSLHEPC
jgi:hypothetical protein